VGEPSKSDAAPPSREIGGFELIEKIGQGGMGTVFKARQKSLDRIVALKILPPSVAKDAKFIERFQREARACARLNHPNIVQGVDVGKDSATGVWYFAMEIVDGPSVLKLLKTERVLQEERALEIARDVARALECACSHGIVHRDIKPDNILLTQNGEAKLADLGLARQINDDASLTQSGQAVGTPHYMAPEQVRGQTDKFDTRTDIYALGGTLFHLVTGQPPYAGETSAVIMARHLTDPVPRAHKVNPAVSEACSRLIERMMQKEREQRIQTPAELLAQIERILSGETTSARPPIKGHAVSRRKKEPVEKPGPSKTPLLLAGAGAVVVLLIVMVMAGSPPRPESKAAADARAALPLAPAPVDSSKESSKPGLRPANPGAAAATPLSTPAPVAATAESMPKSMLPAASEEPKVADAAETSATPVAAVPQEKPKPEAVPEKLTEWPLTDWPLAAIFTALRENSPTKALESVKDGHHAGKPAMLDAMKLLVAQREARIAALKTFVGKFVKLDTVKGPQNGKLASFENNMLNLEREIVINGESRGASKAAVAMDDLLPVCREKLAPTPSPASSTDWLAATLTGMAERQWDAADAALMKVNAGELRDILSAELKRTRVAELEARAAAAWAKILAHAAEATSQTKAKQLLEELAAFSKQFEASDFAAKPEIGAKIKELTESFERLSMGMDPRVLKLFKGRVINYDAKTQVITLGYDLQTKEQTEDFIDSMWAPPGDTTGITWKKGELKTFCKGTADRVFKMPQFASGSLNLQFDYRKPTFAWGRYEVEISLHGLDSAGKTPKASFKGTDKGAFFFVNGGEVKSNTDAPMFAKEGTLELSCQGATLSAKVNGKSVMEFALPKPNDHSGFWIGGGWDSGITFTRLQVSGRLDPAWLAKALEAVPKGR